MTAMTTGRFEVWTDGSAKHGTGGWGWVTADGRTGGGAEKPSTNQRMELTAALEAIWALPDRPLLVVSDSAYLVNCFQQRWWRNWVRNGWVNSKKEPVANRDIWEPLVRLAIEEDVAFRWVKGHAGHPLNEAADQVAEAARLGRPWDSLVLPLEGYLA
ncbi:ribonuclease H family protein [Nocardioides pakistanensis]